MGIIVIITRMIYFSYWALMICVGLFPIGISFKRAIQDKFSIKIEVIEVFPV